MDHFKFRELRALFFFSIVMAFLINALDLQHRLQHSIVVLLPVYTALIVVTVKYVFDHYRESLDHVQIWSATHLLVTFVLVL